jgi:hypothetical protein
MRHRELIDFSRFDKSFCYSILCNGSPQALTYWNLNSSLLTQVNSGHIWDDG